MQRIGELERILHQAAVVEHRLEDRAHVRACRHVEIDWNRYGTFVDSRSIVQDELVHPIRILQSERRDDPSTERVVRVAADPVHEHERQAAARVVVPNAPAEHLLLPKLRQRGQRELRGFRIHWTPLRRGAL